MIATDYIALYALGGLALASLAQPFTRKHAWRRALTGFGIGVSASFLLVTSMMSWLLRDGLGPDAIASSGTVAIHRFAAGGWFPMLIGIGGIGLTIILDKSARTRIGE